VSLPHLFLTSSSFSTSSSTSIKGLLNLGRLLTPSLERGERTLTLESRRYAYHTAGNSTERKKRKNENENYGENDDENIESGYTDYVVCTYYQPVLQIREKASKYGVRRACVLLGENGTCGLFVRAMHMVRYIHFRSILL
jgi:hypothetical protein